MLLLSWLNTNKLLQFRRIEGWGCLETLQVVAKAFVGRKVLVNDGGPALHNKLVGRVPFVAAAVEVPAVHLNEALVVVRSCFDHFRRQPALLVSLHFQVHRSRFLHARHRHARAQRHAFFVLVVRVNEQRSRVARVHGFRLGDGPRVEYHVGDVRFRRSVLGEGGVVLARFAVLKQRLLLVVERVYGAPVVGKFPVAKVEGDELLAADDGVVEGGLVALPLAAMVRKVLQPAHPVAAHDKLVVVNFAPGNFLHALGHVDVRHHARQVLELLQLLAVQSTAQLGRQVDQHLFEVLVHVFAGVCPHLRLLFHQEGNKMVGLKLALDLRHQPPHDVYFVQRRPADRLEHFRQRQVAHVADAVLRRVHRVDLHPQRLRQTEHGEDVGPGAVLGAVLQSFDEAVRSGQLPAFLQRLEVVSHPLEREEPERVVVLFGGEQADRNGVEQAVAVGGAVESDKVFLVVAVQHSVGFLVHFDGHLVRGHAGVFVVGQLAVQRHQLEGLDQKVGVERHVGQLGPNK